MTQPITNFLYRDPLAAAWMAKHFGMKFKDWYWNNEQFVFEYPEVDLPNSPPLYIDADSLHILQPQAGDLVCYSAMDEVFYERTITPGTCYKDYEIIQRNDIAFHWPESEAA